MNLIHYKDDGCALVAYVYKGGAVLEVQTLRLQAGKVARLDAPGFPLVTYAGQKNAGVPVTYRSKSQFAAAICAHEYQTANGFYTAIDRAKSQANAL